MRQSLHHLVPILCGTGVTACGAYLAWDPGGCVFLSAIPSCDEYALELYRIERGLGDFYGPIWRVGERFVREHFSMFAGGYALIALHFLTQAKYRDNDGGSFQFFFLNSIVCGVFFFGGLWGYIVLRQIAWLTVLTALLTIGLACVVWVGVPLYLLFCLVLIFFNLPYALWALLRFTVRAPFLLWHYLHYFFVPHPAERVYRAGIQKHIPLPELARNVADIMYQYDCNSYEDLPKSWKSKNWQKRLDALRERIHAEDKFMEELIRNLRLKSQLHE